MSRSNSKSSSKSASSSAGPSRASTNPTAQLLAASASSRSSPPYISPYAPITSATTQSQSISAGSTYLDVPSSTSLSRRSSPSASEASGSGLYRQFTMSSTQSTGASDKAKLIKSLEAHSVNTLVELRRIEKVLAGDPNATSPMTNAWAHYVNSNNLLSELRSLTKNYPFSSECLDEAKWMVISDPQSSRSWNYCWLVLQKAKIQNLIPKHARQLAAKPEMWGGKQPTGQNVEQLANACSSEWSRALNQMLRHWETAPTLAGR